jgi:hypothetical protein
MGLHQQDYGKLPQASFRVIHVFECCTQAGDGNVVVVNTRSAILRSMDKSIYTENHNGHAENVVCVSQAPRRRRGDLVTFSKPRYPVPRLLTHVPCMPNHNPKIEPKKRNP